MGVGDDRPFSYWDLAPYYDLNDRTVGVAGVPGNPAYPKRNVELLPLPGFTWGENKLREVCDRLGWFSLSEIQSSKACGKPTRDYVSQHPTAAEPGVATNNV
jgi:hypothetical protein